MSVFTSGGYIRCAKCSNRDAKGSRECSSCGALYRDMKRKQDEPQAIEGIPSTCSYPGCRLPPAWSDNTRGGGPWVCRWHARETDPVVMGEIVELSRDFVPDTPTDRIREAQQAANVWMASNGLQRRSDESSVDFGRRCSAHIRSLRQMRSPGLWWAVDVLARLDAGEPIGMAMEKMAREALARRGKGDDLDDEARAA